MAKQITTQKAFGTIKNLMRDDKKIKLSIKNVWVKSLLPQEGEQNPESKYKLNCGLVIGTADDEIKKILGENFMRVFKQVLV